MENKQSDYPSNNVSYFIDYLDHYSITLDRNTRGKYSWTNKIRANTFDEVTSALEDVEAYMRREFGE